MLQPGDRVRLNPDNLKPKFREQSQDVLGTVVVVREDLIVCKWPNGTVKSYGPREVLKVEVA
jgi:hypothetical protein